MPFLSDWADAALISLEFFWLAFWAFGLGYVISAAIRVFVSRGVMQRAMGQQGARSVALATFFGFLSSSCSFAALSATRSFLAKGAGLVPALAFLLSSTNLVVELGIVISVFLSWHFVVAEYLGGVLLIALMWGIVRLTRPGRLIEAMRDRLEAEDGDTRWPVAALWRDRQVWDVLAQSYLGEWRMVWKDVTIGFTVAGLIAAFVPSGFFVWLFPGTGSAGPLGFDQVLAQAVIGPVAAVFTFIGSMGNIPLAGLLFANGVSVAGIMAFIFSDLVVLPVLRVNARFYGWAMSLYIAAVFLVALVLTSVAIHYGFELAGMTPHAVTDAVPGAGSRFTLNYTFWLNLGFAGVSLAALWAAWRGASRRGGPAGRRPRARGGERLLHWLALLCLVWLVGGGLLSVAAVLLAQGV